MDQSVEEKITRDWNTEINGSMTLFGVLYTYFDLVAEHWNPETQRRYMANYNDFLLEEFDHIALIDCDRGFFDQAIVHVHDKLEANGKACGANILQHYRILIRRVTAAAAVAGICPDVLWGTIYSEAPTRDEGDEIRARRQRRSLTAEEEVLVCRNVLCEPEQAGQNMGLALMFSLGLRNGEACAVCYGDLYPVMGESMCYVVAIYKSSKNGKTVWKDSGKTRNAVRLIPAPQALEDLILQRRAYIEAQIRDGKFSLPGVAADADQETLDDAINRLPIACVDDRYDVPCTTNQLTAAAGKLFREIRMDEMMLRQIDDSLQHQDEKTGLFREAEATAYLLRRNFATQMYLVGLSAPEIQYVLGHDVEDSEESRADYRNDEKLRQIAEKMGRRFLLNPTGQQVITESAPITQLQNVTDVRVQITPKGKKGLTFVIHSNDPACKLRIKADVQGATVQGTMTQWPAVSRQREQYNICEVLRQRYAAAVRNLGSSGRFDPENVFESGAGTETADGSADNQATTEKLPEEPATED